MPKRSVRELHGSRRTSAVLSIPCGASPPLLFLFLLSPGKRDMARRSGSPMSLATHSRSSSIGPPSPRRQKRASSPTSSYASGSPQFAGRDSLRSDSSQSGSLSTHDAPHPDLESPIIPIALRGENAPKLSIETSSTVNDEVHQAFNFIKHFCKRRGETAEVWVGKVRSELMAADGQHIDFHDTLTMLHRVLERLQKGEFLVSRAHIGFSNLKTDERI